jgi:hypothetical protein
MSCTPLMNPRAEILPSYRVREQGKITRREDSQVTCRSSLVVGTLPLEHVRLNAQKGTFHNLVWGEGIRILETVSRILDVLHLVSDDVVLLPDRRLAACNVSSDLFKCGGCV